MEYVFGSVRRSGVMVENVKTVGEEHTNLTGTTSITRKYADSHITDNFFVLEKYRSEEDAEGRCYDWYVIRNHYRYEDRFTPNIGATEEKIDVLENGICEESMATEERLGDIENAICELSEVLL